MTQPGPVHTRAELFPSSAHAAIGTQTLAQKIVWLQRNRSTDLLQQMQTEAIVELYEAVRQIQQSLSTMPPVIPSGVGAAREAAARKAATSGPALKPGIRHG